MQFVNEKKLNYITLKLIRKNLRFLKIRIAYLDAKLIDYLNK